MFSERKYKQYQNQQHSNFYGVPAIIAITIFVYILQNVVATNNGFFSYSPITYSLALNPYAFKSGQVWRIVTYMFLHAGIIHIAFNMYGVYLFGRILERHIGSVKFLQLYFISGIVGGVIWMLCNFNTNAICIGASGALFGVMVAVAMLYPNAQIQMIIPPIPLKMKTFVLVYAIVEVLLGTSGMEGNIAHFAHIGGLVGGYFFIRFLYPETFDIFVFIGLRKKRDPALKSYSQKAAKKWTFTSASTNSVDQILDKISKSGINSLSENELEILRQAREKMKR